MTRQRRTVDERRAQLIELGLGAFGRRPFDEVSIDDIAREAGISKGLLYHYFATKQAFYLEVVREAARRLLERTETSPDLSPLDRLTSGLDAYLSFVDEHAPAYGALLRGGTSDQAVRAVISETRNTFIERLLGGLPDSVTPTQRLTLVGWVGFVEAASLDWLEHRALQRDELRDLLSRALLTLLPT